MGDDWRDKAASLMCVGMGSAQLDDQVRALIDVGVSGVVLNQKRLDRPESVAELIHSIKSYAARPLFVAVDHEGAGRSRLQGGFTRLPEATELGRLADPELARSIGQILGKELRAVGVDMTLGPVLDLSTNPNNESMSRRSLGSDPERVADLAAAMISGQQSEGVAACGKHFPGHGDTYQDSNLALPELNHGVSRLEKVELKPFEAAIEARMAGMMVGHILFRVLDEVLPASLSRAIVFGLLRQKLAYRGFLMIDDVDMVALSQRFTKAEIAVRGVLSGADCFLCGRRPQSAFELIEAIVAGVNTGEIPPERIESARRRVAPLLHRYARDPGSNPDLAHVGTQANVEVLGRVGGGRPSLFPKSS